MSGICIRIDGFHRIYFSFGNRDLDFVCSPPVLGKQQFLLSVLPEFSAVPSENLKLWSVSYRAIQISDGDSTFDGEESPDAAEVCPRKFECRGLPGWRTP